MKIKILTACMVAGTPVEAGAVVDAPDSAAEMLLGYKMAEKHTGPLPDPAEGESDSEGDDLVLTYDSLKAMSREDQLKIAADFELTIPKKAKEEDIIEAILSALPETQE